MTDKVCRISDEQFEFFSLCDIDDSKMEEHFAGIYQEQIDGEDYVGDWIDCSKELRRILNLPRFLDMGIEEASLMDDILSAAVFASFACGVKQTAKFLKADPDETLSEILL